MAACAPRLLLVLVKVQQPAEMLDSPCERPVFSPAERACEKGHWTKAYDRDRAALGPAAFAKLTAKVLAVAARLRAGDIRPPPRRPMAFLMTTWHNERRDRKRARSPAG